MDPVSALGAAGSVVGIVAFGLELSRLLNRCVGKYRDAPASLERTIDSIRRTVRCLTQVRYFITLEEQHSRDKDSLQFCSPQLLGSLKDVSCECLLVFWRVEAVVTRTDGRRLEQKLTDRLNQLNEDWGAADSPSSVPIHVGEGISNRRLEGVWDRLRWMRKESEIHQYQHSLGEYRLELNFMISIVSLRAHQLQLYVSPTLA